MAQRMAPLTHHKVPGSNPLSWQLFHWTRNVIIIAYIVPQRGLKTNSHLIAYSLTAFFLKWPCKLSLNSKIHFDFGIVKGEASPSTYADWVNGKLI